VSWQVGLMCLFGGISCLALFAWLIEREVRKGPGKRPNIRVPRETLWERTNKYHGSKS
jgi:hypothetical protein